jgi:5-methylcytosine-specific restriction endonuclease McrA
MASAEWKWRRREAIIRDDYTCNECGAEGGPKGNARLQVHHITPVGDGGSDDLENLETLCSECHETRHYNDAEEYFDAIRANAPASTKEIADAVGVTRQGADYRLRQLEEDGKVESKMVGNSLLWQLVDEEI